MSDNIRNKISDLLEFLAKAIKLGKYNANTGNGLLNAIRTAERGFQSDEPKDIDYLLSHVEELFFRQQELNLSPQSQAVYFARVKRAVEDYKKYGMDAKSIYSWSPKQRISKPTSTKKSSSNGKNEDLNNEENQQQTVTNKTDEIIKEVGGIKLNVVTWRLRPGVLVKIELPEDLTKADVERIKRLLDLEIEVFE